MTQEHRHIVRRLRFDVRAEIVEESTYATEGELSGYKGQQLPMSIGQGQLPLTTLPLFANTSEKGNQGP